MWLEEFLNKLSDSNLEISPRALVTATSCMEIFGEHNATQLEFQASHVVRFNGLHGAMGGVVDTFRSH